MMKIYLAILAGLMVLTVRYASADDAMTTCNQNYDDCNARAQTLVNDIDVSDAKEVCGKTLQGCKHRAESEFQKQEQKQLEEAEKPADKPQEDDTVNGNIKVYRFDK